MAAATVATVLGTLGAAYAATEDSALYMIVDLTKSLGASGQITYIDESELTNNVGGWGTWVRNPVTNRGTVVQSVIWTGVTNGTTYKTDKLVLRRIPSGSYYEGVEGDGNNATNVILTKDQYVGVFEVTQQQWNRVMNSGTGTDIQAKHSISYYDIRENADNNTAIDPNWPQTNAVGSTSFMGRLRLLTGIDEFDLPTEGQWEYACRAETTTYYNDGLATSHDSQLDVLGWYSGSEPKPTAAQPVGGLLPNAWGLYDMHGNVWEWCLDWYASSPEIGIDPDRAVSGSGSRVLRGGGWSDAASGCRSAYRSSSPPSSRDSRIGFRVVLISENGLPIGYRLQRPAQVSINIYDAQGQIVRELLHAKPSLAGRNREMWDGRDEAGQPVVPGQYAWKLLATPGLHAEYLMSIGNSYPNGPDDWRHRAPGTHGGSTAVTVDDTGIYVAASCTENIENYLIKIDPAATNRLWSEFQHVAWNGGSALASANSTLFVLGNNRDIWLYDAGTGKRGKTFQPVVGEEKPVDLAARGEQLAVCYPGNNVVQWLDPKTGAVNDEATVASASALAVVSDGTVFAISSNTVVRVTRGETETVIVVTDLVDPQRLDVDEATGELLVVEGGESQQVKRFSRKGLLLATYGRSGGRQDGLYHPEDFRGVSDITCDGAGGFLIAEPNTAPRRVGHFDKDGRLIKEWYGGQTWAPWVAVEPDNPNAVWMNSSWTDMMRLTVDYQTRTWKVHSVYRYAGLAEGLIPGNSNATVWEARLHAGQLYLCRIGHGGGDPCVIRVDRKNWKLVPATVCASHIQHYRKYQPGIVADAMEKNDAYQWNDANGDGQPQAEEFTFTTAGGPWHGQGGYDNDSNFLFHGGQYQVTAWNEAGAPVYGTFPAPDPMPAPPARVSQIEPRWGSYFQRDSATGDLYGAFNDRMPTWGQSEDSFLVKWDATGQEQWTVGRLGEGPGRIWRPFRRFVGIAHSCPVLTGFSYEYPADGVTATYVWDSDGLWVGSVFDHLDLTAAPENLYSLGGEALSAQLVPQADGSVLFFGCWLNEVRVYRITGWEGWVRRSGTLTVPTGFEPPAATVPVPSGNGTGLVGEYFQTSRPTDDALVLTRVDPVIDFTWGVWGTENCTPTEQIKTAYSVRWTGFIVPPQTGLYGFRSDGPTMVGKITVEGQTYTSPSRDRVARATYSAWLEAGQPYPIQIAYNTWNTHHTTTHGIQLQWLPPGGVWHPVPTHALYPNLPAQPVPNKEN